MKKLFKLNIKKMSKNSEIFKYLTQFSLKKQTFGKKNSGGRNFLGRVCIVGRGGGTKKKYIFIDFFRKINNFGTIIKIIKDLNRTGYIGLVFYKNGLTNFILISEYSKLGDTIFSGKIVDKTIFNNLKENNS
jgi:large subunit ribosomal protein L2